MEYLFGGYAVVCIVALALFMFVSGVAGTLAGILIARIMLRCIVGSEGYEGYSNNVPVEAKLPIIVDRLLNGRFVTNANAGETHGNSTTSGRNRSGNLSKFCTIRFIGNRRRHLG